LKGLYLFGDFITGRLWALPLPERSDQYVRDPFALGRRDLLISTFGRDAAGKVYVTDFTRGVIYRIDPLP